MLMITTHCDRPTCHGTVRFAYEQSARKAHSRIRRTQSADHVGSSIGIPTPASGANGSGEFDDICSADRDL